VLFSLRDARTPGFKFMDAPKHALNGALIHDYLKNGDLTHPIDFAKRFYSRFPAITIPFHPPFSAVMEAAFYAVFGVNFLAARLYVACAAGISAFLLYQIFLRSHHSHRFALIASLIFMTSMIFVATISDTMTDVPVLAMILGALYCLGDLESGYPPRRAYAFAILAGTAVWTKQHAAFLGVIPFILVILHRNWRMLRNVHLWCSSLLFGLMVLALTRLSAPLEHVGVAKQFAPPQRFLGTSWFNIKYYVRVLRWHAGPMVTFWILGATLAYLLIPRLRTRPEGRLYVAWVLAIQPLLLLTALHDLRYLFLALPAFVVLACDFSKWTCECLIPMRHVQRVALALAVSLIAYQCYFLATHFPKDYANRGALQAPLARVIKERKSQRTLYCGPNVAYLAIWLRYLNPDSQTIMIRGEKLDPAVFTPEGFERFAHRFGVDTVVFEPMEKPSAWDSLEASPSRSMVLEQVIIDPKNKDLQSKVFEFTNPSSHPESALAVPVSLSGGVLNIDL
jgi:hypothetical protein